MAKFIGGTSIIFYFLVLNAGEPLAQTPPDAGTLLQEQQRTEPRAFERMPPWETPEEKRPQLEESGVKFTVRGFRFTGAEGMASESELREIVKDAIGSEIGLAGLKRLADRVTKYLQSRGWFLARAYIPKQEVKDGIIEIAIVAGRLEGSAVIRGRNLRISEELLQKMITPSPEQNEAANQRGLERAILLINDLPGIKAGSTLEPGTKPGSAKVIVDASEGSILGGRVWGDNYGTRYTGSYRGSGLLQVNDPLCYGDQVFLSSTDNDLYQYGQAGYSFPIGYSGLRGGILYSEMRYEIDPDLIPLDLDGGARIAGASVSYPIMRSRTVNLWAGVDYYWRNLWDRSSGIVFDDKYTNSGGIHLYGDKIDTLLGGGYNSFNLGVTVGALDRSAVQADLIADRATADSQGGYGKLIFGAHRLQKVYQHLNLLLSVNGQVAFDNLDTSEKFLIGGPYGVRAYPVGEAAGDSGGVFTAELRYDFPPVTYIGVPQLVGFYDLGWTQLHQSPWVNSGTPIGNRNSYTISGAGLGLNIVKSDLYQIQAAWAAKIGTNPGRSLAGDDADGKSEDNRYWIQAMIRF